MSRTVGEQHFSVMVVDDEGYRDGAGRRVSTIRASPKVQVVRAHSTCKRVACLVVYYIRSLQEISKAHYRF
jgi:hypothetical protein